MKIGISLGVVRPALWAELTREADQLGYESVWMPEHLVIPVGMSGSPHAGAEHPPIPPDVPVFDVFAYLSFLAGQTEHIHFGTQVYNIGLRHPFIVARAVATLDVVSNGRLEFGIGASWLEAEWEAVGLDFATRGRRVDESIDICRRLWSEEVVEHHGEFFDFGPVMFEPKPTHAPWPPLHIGGDGPAALRRAAQVGDGWIPMNHTLEEIPAAATRIAQLREAAGRPGDVEITLGGGGTELDELKRFADAGVGRVLVRPWQRGSEALDGIRRFAEQVLPEIRDHPVAPPER
ncbi:MAG TPA: TIGR03619 family F420-dependent LLM class oxidoreductase [Acidimicrobiales bacterium]|nr:TIGR03619 family F420-dependent LLM class oxidoreductase [Acidimicrobiales bacterium]